MFEKEKTVSVENDQSIYDSKNDQNEIENIEIDYKKRGVY
jgi:hypothetical protein